jgi:hypothetical protein
MTQQLEQSLDTEPTAARPPLVTVRDLEVKLSGKRILRISISTSPAVA